MMPLCGLVLHLAGVLALEPVEVPPLLPPSADAPDPELALEEPKVLPPLGDAMRRAYGAAGLAAILGLPLFPTAALGVASAVPLAMLGAMFLGLFVGPFAGAAAAGLLVGGLVGAFSVVTTGAAALAAWPGEQGTSRIAFVGSLALLHGALVAPVAALIPLALLSVPTFLLLAGLFDFGAVHDGNSTFRLLSLLSLGGAAGSAGVLVLAVLGTACAVVLGGALSPALAVLLGRALTGGE